MDPRRAKLNKLFESISRGTQQLTPKNGTLFLEAICAQEDAVATLHKLSTSSEGKSALQAAMRFNLLPAFFNGQATGLLQYLQTPGLADINGGEFLNDILLKIVDPPIFWVAFRKAFIDEKLNDTAQKSFLWLLVKLVSIPGEKGALYREPSQISIILPGLRSSSKNELRTAGYKIEHMLDTYAQPNLESLAFDAAPGGRHDNDFSDFRKISILPTPDEIQSTENAFLRTSDVLEDPGTESNRVPLHLDNQFRLLREDMIYELRDEIQVVQGKKKGHHRGIRISGLELVGIQSGPEDKPTRWGLSLKCHKDLPELKAQKDRKKYLLEQRNFFRHQSSACLIAGGEIVAFPTIDRNEDLLAANPPIIVVQLEGRESTELALRKLKTENDVALIQINTAIFSYEPILKYLQQAYSIPLSDELLLWKEGNVMSQISCQSVPVVEALKRNPKVDLQTLLETNSTIKLDSSQAASLYSGLTQKVALVQGPPGTGKSFLGALLAKAIYKFTEQTILVVCYTNHALDDILTGLMDIGIPQTSMVRLGGKSTARTEPLTLRNIQQTPRPRRDQTEWMVIDGLKSMLKKLQRQLQQAFERYKSAHISYQDLLDHLEFEEDLFFEAFRVPESEDGLTHVGKGGRAVKSDYLIDRWCMGLDAGIFKNSYPDVQATHDIWCLSYQARQELITRWKEKIFGESIAEVCVIAQEYNSCQERLARSFSDKLVHTLRSKRVIGCTTTAAAKYTEDIQAASPDVLIVEEAGEILESHVLAALGKKTSQLILIGDHKQLRPKVNNYALTVEKGDSFDLNRSLFERLVLKGYPHQTLSEQHRMRPEISFLIRNLTYPELRDAPKTKGRPNLDGVQDNIVFIDHDHPEDENHRISDRRDMASSSSKQNSHEVAMILKIVRYLAQQGYGTDKIVILTPYLGQLQKLREVLMKDNDPILNDLDSYDLVRAGLISAATAKLAKKPIRLSTIDNYQGEESDIVIVSLTRSNANHDIGFMFSPERLNVLLSRARNALIMIGNSHTFKKSRKGGELWGKLFELLGQGKHVYSGLPVVCQRHPDRKNNLSQPTDFDEVCPDGGCNIPCDTKLGCGTHRCPSKCHQLYDHSKMLCEENMSCLCDLRGHKQSFKCHQGPPKSCRKCDQIEKADKKKRQEEYEAQQRRDSELQEHLRELAEIDAEIAREVEARQATRLARDRADALRQRRMDLESIRQQALIQADPISNSSGPANPPTSPSNSDFLTGVVSTAKALLYGKPDSPSSANQPASPNQSAQVNQLASPNQSAQTPPSPFRLPDSPSRNEWQRQKDMEGANNDGIDSIMEMVGLEDVKKQVLEIKAKVDISIRQGASIASERFNVVLLGNPGTGKTTIARQYAKFLVTVGALPGPSFIETTGSRLANEGVDGIKKQIEDLLKVGGGAIFVDEAYQLASTHNHGGPVLDFLLAEMENNIGSIVFMFAGYNKEMEAFFEHNPGLKSRVPYRLQFSDYEDHELMTILEGLIFKAFRGRMKVQDGIRGLYGRIAIRRLGRRRGRNGFGNARDLQTAFAAVRGRQASRIEKERAEGKTPDDFLLVAQDLIGPDPSKAILQSEAWSKLQSLIGLKAVKESITSLIHAIEENFQRELQEKEPLTFSLNRVFLGSPGTGKTTVAKLYGKVLADLGLLSNGEVVLKTPADFIGAYLGESEKKTKNILTNSIGKVLIIDEAYMLYGGGGNSAGNQSNQFKTTVIDTIVAEVQSVPGDDQCVLLLGYKDQMVEMFQNVNEGLARRFRIEDPFNFEDFSTSELMDILNKKLKEQDLGATDAAKKIVIEQLNRSRNRPNFGNAGEVENMIGAAKVRSVARRAAIPLPQRPIHIIFEPQDFCPDFDRSANASSNLAKLFEDIVGCQDIISRLGEYQQIAVVSKARGVDPREQIPTNFVFIGPPGTGKTTIARKMGQVYYDMGILASAEVIECSASDLVGEYVGHTGPKTKKLFEKALGKVLFIDEAYRLGEGRFAQEAVDELVGLLTHESFKSKVIVILAGYEGDMKQLMSVNTGLASRFPDWIPFSNMDPDHCLNVVLKELRRKGVKADELLDQSSDVYRDMTATITELSQLPDWGNARDMMNLAKELISLAFLTNDEKQDSLSLSGNQIVACTKKMLADKQARSNIRPKSRHTLPAMPEQDLAPSAQPPPPIQTAQNAKKAASPAGRPGPSRQGARPAAPPPKPPPPKPSNLRHNIQRDPGVSDDVWRELQDAKQLIEAQEKRTQETIKRLQREIEKEAKREREQKREAERLAKAEAEAKDAAERQEAKRKREQARLREQAARQAREKAAADLRAKQQEQQRLQAQEAKAQRKLREMGVCVAGFQ